MPQEDKVSKFIDAITREATQQREQMANETESYIAREIEKAEKQAQLDMEKNVERRSAAIRQDMGRLESQKQLEMRTRLFECRNEISGKVFSEVSERIKAFRKTPDYKAFLIESTKTSAAALPAGDLKVYLMEDDKAYSGDIEKASGRKCQFIADSMITLGGLRFENSAFAVSADDTLDTRLDSEKEWFRENSGLTIS